MIEDIIISLCNTRHKKLTRPAKIASKSPDTQVKIYNKSAYYVIKDCADITLRYLSHFIYSQIDDPIGKLRGIVTEQDITDFVGRAATDSCTRQLLQIIVNDITPGNFQRPRSPITDFTISDDEDVYGDYEYTENDIIDIDESIIKENIIDINNAAEVINKLKSVLCD